jgi:hypothetical protein
MSSVRRFPFVVRSLEDETFGLYLCTGFDVFWIFVKQRCSCKSTPRAENKRDKTFQNDMSQMSKQPVIKRPERRDVPRNELMIRPERSISETFHVTHIVRPTG